MAPQSVILITGCSSGIGAALAEEFHERGHRVYASARRPESMGTLAACGIRTLALNARARTRALRIDSQPLRVRLYPFFARAAAMASVATLRSSFIFLNAGRSLIIFRYGLTGAQSSSTSRP